MTRCFTALELEQLAIQEPRESDTGSINHLKECPFCAQRFSEFLEFYNSVEEEYTALDTGNPPLTITQTPHRYVLSSLNRVERLEVEQDLIPTLAADSSIMKQAQTVENIGVYTSVDDQLMVRILKEPNGGYTLFLLADDPSLYQNVLVQIVGMEQEYISDAQGQIHLGEIDMPDIDSLGIEVRTATSIYDLQSVFPPEQLFVGEETITLEGGEHKHIGLQVLTQGEVYSLKIDLHEITQQMGPSQLRVMVVKNKELAEVQHPAQGIAMFKDILDPASVQIKIFE